MNDPRGVPGLSPEQLEIARRVNAEQDATQEHNENLSRERRVGQFTLGALDGTLYGGLGAMVVKGADALTHTNLTADKRGLVLVAATVVTGAVTGFKNLRNRKKEADRVAAFESNQSPKPSPAS